MSKFKQSSITPHHRGKLGGSVFSENRYGPYQKLKSIPSNPKTTPQQNVRSTLKGFSQMWSKNLIEKQYKSWMKLEGKFKRYNSSGNKYYLAARDIFTFLNSNLKSVGLPVKLDAPTKFTVQSFPSFKFKIIEDNGKVDIRMYFKPSIKKDTRLIIIATKPLKYSIFYFRKDAFRNIGYVDNTFKSGDSILSIYKSVFTNPDFSGSFKIAFHVRPVSCSSGFSKDLLESSASLCKR